MGRCTMDRSNIDKISQDPEDRLLLAKIWDKIQNGMRRNIPAATGFLSPREQEMAKYLFGQQAELMFFGGYPEAERKSLIYLPDYLEEDFLTSEDSPLVCVAGSFYAGDCLTHRDILGSLIGAGVQRQAIGDIAVGDGCFFVFVTAQMAPFILQNLTQAGRVHLSLRQVSLDNLSLPQAKTREIRDTLASLRLDGVVSAGFSIGRSQAAQHIAAGRVAVDGRPWEKPDKQVAEGAKISLRGMGKICLKAVNGQTKKGRISVVIDRYI